MARKQWRASSDGTSACYRTGPNRDENPRMRYVIYGAGAIGATIGAALHMQGHDVRLIARRLHLQTLQTDGLTFISPGRTLHLPIPATDDPATLALRDEDVVFLAMKSQHTAGALAALRAATAAAPAVICAQNGVENERLALRVFPHVYGMEVVMPATHLQPGCVEAHCRDPYGLLDFGRIGPMPAGSDPLAEQIARDLLGAGFGCELRARIMPWKYRKLVLNLGNGVNLLIGAAAESRDIVRMLRGEAAAVLASAGIDVTPEDEYRKRTDLLDKSATDHTRRAGSSTWQSALRGAGNVETDYLNGEITLLGRLHGVPTPVNALIQELCAEHAARMLPPGTYPSGQLLGRARAQAQTVQARHE